MRDKIFIPKSNGDYEEIHIPSALNGSINDIGLYLGYSPNQIYCYYGAIAGNSNFTAIIFKKFSKSILAILASDKYVHLSRKDVDGFLEDFDYDSEYDTYNRESDLKESIADRSLTRQFFCEVLDLPYTEDNSNEEMYDLLNGYCYFFEDNILIDFKPLEKISGWAKQFKETNPQFYAEIKRYAQDYWNNDETRVNYEVSGHFDAFASIPRGFKNEMLKFFHLQGIYVYNFKILETITTNKPISLQDFIFFTHNEANLIDNRDTILGGILTYSYRNFVFQFTEEGDYIMSFSKQ